MDKFREFINKQDWVFAKSYANFAPHEYIVRRMIEGNDQEFIDAVIYIRENGIPMYFWKKKYIYLPLDGMLYWTMGDPIEETELINRCYIEDCEISIKTGVRIDR